MYEIKTCARVDFKIHCNFNKRCNRQITIHVYFVSNYIKKVMQGENLIFFSFYLPWYYILLY